MYFPFEGQGVDTTWEFRLSRAANQMDFRTLSDVQITLDYTALHSPDYQKQVIGDLDRMLRGDRMFSFRGEFADAWYNLDNPELLAAAEQFVVSVNIARDDFPPNIDALVLSQLQLFVLRADGLTEELTVTSLTIAQAPGVVPIGGAAQTVEGLISTGHENAAGWLGLLGKPPFGVWTLNLQKHKLGSTPFRAARARGRRLALDEAVGLARMVSLQAHPTALSRTGELASQ